MQHDISHDGHWLYLGTEGKNEPPIPQLGLGDPVEVAPTADAGSFGSVGIVEGVGGSKYCVKMFHRDAGPNPEAVKAAMDQEVDKLVILDGLRECEAASTPRVYSVGQAMTRSLRESQYAYCMDRVPGVKLFEAVTGGLLSGPDGGVGILPPAYRVAQVGLNLVEGYEAMHGRGVIHRDGSPDNLYVDVADSDHVWIIDFGSSVNLADAAKTVCRLASPAYGAPEIFDEDPAHAENRWTPEQDVYTLGALLCFMRAGEHPRLTEYTPSRGLHIDYIGPKMRPLELSEELKASGSSTRWVGNLEMGPGDNDLADIIRRCTEFDMEKRPKLSEIREALWFVSLCDPRTPEAEPGELIEALRALGMPADPDTVTDGLVAYGWAERSWNALANTGGFNTDRRTLPPLDYMPFGERELNVSIGFYERAINLGVNSLKAHVNAARLTRWQVFYRIKEAKTKGRNPFSSFDYDAELATISLADLLRPTSLEDGIIVDYEKSKDGILAALEELEGRNTIIEEEIKAFFRLVDCLIPPERDYEHRWRNWNYDIGIKGQAEKPVLLPRDISDFARKVLQRLHEVTLDERYAGQRVTMLLALANSFDEIGAYVEERRCLEEAQKTSVGDEALEVKVRLADLYREQHLKRREEIERLYREIIGPMTLSSSREHYQKSSVKRAAEGLLQLQGNGPFPLRTVKERNTLMRIAGRTKTLFTDSPWLASAKEAIESPFAQTFVDFAKAYPLWGGTPLKKSGTDFDTDDVMRLLDCYDWRDAGGK